MVERFDRSCIWLRQHLFVAFVLGLLSAGVAYAMAGIAGAAPASNHAPLITYWSRRKVKWIACLTLIGELYYLGKGLYGAVLASLWAALSVPLVLLFGLVIVEVLFEIVKRSDGFALTQVHTYERAECRQAIVGPARLCSALIGRANPGIRPTLGLLWAWLVGAVYVATFVAGVALTITIGFFVVTIAIALFIAALFIGRPDPPLPDPLADYPPVPFDDCVVLGRKGRGIVRRRKGIIYRGRERVGYVEAGVILHLRERTKTPVRVYELRGESIYDLITDEEYGSFDRSAIYAPNGDVLFKLAEDQT